MSNQPIFITLWEPIIKGVKSGLPHTRDYAKQFGLLLLAEFFIFAIHLQLSHLIHPSLILKAISPVFGVGEFLFSIYLAYRINLWVGDIYWKDKLPLFSSTAPNFIRYLKFWFRYHLVFGLQGFGLFIVGLIAFGLCKQISLYVTIPLVIYFFSIRITNLGLLGCMFLKEGDAQAARHKFDPLFHREFWTNSPILWGYLSLVVISCALDLGVSLLFGNGFPLFNPHYHYDWIAMIIQKLVGITLSFFITPGFYLSYWEYLHIMEEKHEENISMLESKIINWKNEQIGE